MNVLEKMAYLRGLMEGAGLSFGEKEQKVVDAMMDLMGEMANKVAELDADLDNLYDGFEAVCDSLDDIEEDLDVLFDEQNGEDGDFEEEDFLYDVECPNCHEVICIDEDTLLEGDISCPNCGETLEFDFSCDCDDCRAEEEAKEKDEKAKKEKK